MSFLKTKQSANPNDFVEVKILDTNLNVAIYGDWKIQICEQNGGGGKNNSGDGCSALIPLSSFDSPTTITPSNPWLTLKSSNPENIGDHINTKTGFDAILIDGSGNLIDYLTVDSYSDAINSVTAPACNLTNLIYDYDAGSPGTSDKFISRQPDGTGDWAKTTSANDDGSSDNTNDEDPNGDPAPIISVADVAVFKGQTATFIFTLTGAPKTYDVSVTYETQNVTAIAGTDYTYKTGIATIPAGQSTTTVDVLTNATSPSAITYFNFFLSNPVNATITNNFPTGTILADASAEWYMDETSWSNTVNEVLDSSGNTNHGTPKRDITTTKNNAAIPATSQNYTGSFAFDSTLSNAGDTSNFNATNTISAASFLNGTASKNDVTYTYPIKETTPITITLRANDPDTGSTAGEVEGSIEIRSGRTRVENSFGSELVDMPVIAQVEYYNTNGFEINTADTCSAVDVTLTDIGTDSIELGTGAGQTCLWDDAGDSVATTDFTCAANASKPQFSEPASSGNFNVNLKAPGADNTGDIGVTLISPTWLKYDWDGDGADDDDPTGTASFGLYRGDDRIIYWREVFN